MQFGANQSNMSVTVYAAGKARKRAIGMTTLREQAYRKITGLLSSGALAPGLVVSQRELVEQTGSNLGAVREAIPRLEAEGLIIPLRQRGMMVPSIDVAFVRNAYHLRRILELEAVRSLPVQFGNEEIGAWIDRHEQFLDAIGNSRSTNTVGAVQTMDWSMHQALIDSLENDLISRTYRVNAIKIRMASQARLRVTTKNAQRILGEHLDFLHALHKGNAVEAAAALELHIENSQSLALGGSLSQVANA